MKIGIDNVISNFNDTLLNEYLLYDKELNNSGISKAFSGYFVRIQDGKFLNRELKNCEIKMYEL